VSAVLPIVPPALLVEAPVRVMVIDDAVVVRGQIRHWLETDGRLDLVASVSNAHDALAEIERADPDVVILDIEMPGMDGLTLLPLLLKKKPGLAVLVASTLTRRNAEIGLRALALGALDCIPKPDADGGITLAGFRHDLIAKTYELGATARRRMARRGGRPARMPARRAGLPLALRPFPRIAPRVLLIGASTGGPQALAALAAHLGAINQQAPVLIVQHMPPTFTTILVEHLGSASGRPVAEAIDGEPVRAGRIYLAPGGFHMRVERRKGSAIIALDDGAPVHFCRPAVDPLLSSAAAVWGSWALGLILTGMGADGSAGAAEIVAAGGSIIAQDEATSVVWGMPGAAAAEGLCSAVLPIAEIGPKLAELFCGARP
jgi:two-component system chemotaxis response regulator CheB